MDGMPQGVQRKPAVFLTRAKEKCDVRIAIHQSLKGGKEGQDGTARLLVSYEAARKLVELPQEALPSIKQRKLHHDGGLRSRSASFALGLDQRPFGPRATFDQGIELHLVLQNLPLVQQQTLL